MATILIFLCGIINFALHKATMESGHPMAAQMHALFQGFMRGWGSYMLEYLILLSALGFAALGYTIALPAYIVYTGMNGLAGWAILTGKI
ncbi:hypothetical protein C7451_11137 [Blastomonas natatoria]|jgi:hypothetical protein|uniref:DoxX-like protein n=1 Tax=Blastomonas natatoria TaxID=34015 RepID=A0A2V3UU85_9SPHN|nr:hypothetical protein [Blastomonas natatoria]PXW72916.1 hypothetical protein C7451_11137 [Blastomonas natatoria]